jgi:acetyl-CoA acetyltransferase
MSLRDVFEDVRIVGVATTEQARSLAPRSGFSLALEALQLALADARLEVGHLDGIGSRVSGWPPGAVGSRGETYAWAWQLKRPLHWSYPDVSIAALLSAAGAIATGQASVVALVLGQTRVVDPSRTATWTRPETEFTGWTGSFTAVQYALVAQRYLHEVGASALDAFAEAAAVIRNFGAVNPEAVYSGRGPFTKADVLESREIASPLTLLMCSSVNDGGGALVLAHKSLARDRSRAIRIIAGADQHAFPPYVEPPLPVGAPDESKFFTERLGAAGVRHDDIDVVEFYDNFASEVVIELERFGFCKRGEAADLVLAGETALNGRFPTCTDGGLLAYSHNGLPALFRSIEAVRQLRGEVRDRCPDCDQGVHTHAAGTCRLVPAVELAFASNPSAPSGGGAFAVYGRD